MADTLADRLVHTDLAVANLDVEAATGVSANPGFVMYWGTISAEIRQGY